jgi:hypothetical protein
MAPLREELLTPKDICGRTFINKTLNIMGLHLSDVMLSVENKAIMLNVVMLSRGSLNWLKR